MELLTAIVSGDLNKVQSLLQQGASPNEPGYEKTTPLMAAAIRGNLEAVQILIEAGADLDLQDDSSQTALMHAICQQNNDVVEQLLDSGARVEVENWLALDFAVRFGTPALVKRFLDMGADANRQDDDDPSLLMEAIGRKNIEMVKLLLDSGANPHAQAEDQTALSLAAQIGDESLVNLFLNLDVDPGPALSAACLNGNVELVKKLIALGVNVDPESGDDFDFSPLSWAANHGHADIVRELIAAGAEIDSRDWMGHTPLWSAAESGHVDCVRLLLDAGADPNVHEDGGDALLINVIWMDEPETLRILLQAGADPDIESAQSPGPLLWAAHKGSLELCRLLLDAGALPDTRMPKKGDHGWKPLRQESTPLMVAAHEGNLELADLLLERGADPSAADKKGKTAADYASAAGRMNILKRLQEAGAKVSLKSRKLHNAALITAVHQGKLKGVRSALEAGADPDYRRRKADESPLTAAATDGHPEIVQALLDAGADPNLTNKYGDQPLKGAIVRQHVDIVRQLLAAGADPNAGYSASSVRSGQHNTVIPSWQSPLMDAAAGGQGEILEMLLEAGADPNSISESGLNPLLAAVQSRKFDAARRLIAAGAQRRPEDADHLAVLDWEAASLADEFQQSIEEVSAATGATPESIEHLPGAISFKLDAPQHDASDDEADEGDDEDMVASTLAWSKQWNQDYEDLAQQVDAAISACAETIRTRGYLLIDVGMPLGCGPMTRFLALLPTDDKYAVMAAFGAHGNDEDLSNRDLIAWFRELERDHPYRLLGCKYDTVVIELDKAFDDPQHWAEEIGKFCPDSVPEDMPLFAKQLRTSRRIHFWWD